MTTRECVLVDLSSIAHPIWHMCQAEPDPNAASQKIVSRVRALASECPHVAICCDAGRSFRHDLSRDYKANRPESEAPLHHQIALAQEQLALDGFPIWAVKGFEADDLIATAATRAVETEGTTVLIVTSDKDLLQLVGPRVRVQKATDGTLIDETVVLDKFGVRPDQMRDYLMLVGDASDNVKGAVGIGPKKAAELLAKYSTLASVYIQMGLDQSQFKPAVATALHEFKRVIDTTQALITLRTDVTIPFDEILAERVSKDAQEFEMETELMETPTVPGDAGPASDAKSSPGLAPADVEPTQALALMSPERAISLGGPAPAEWELMLDPRSMNDARTLATDMFKSRMFSAYGTPQGVLSTIMLGRELGLPAMAALRQIHVIEGKHGLSAQLMVALILKSGMAEYFEPVEFDAVHAIYETKRKGTRHPQRLEHTIEMARIAQLLKPDSNWEKVPTDMLVARCQSRLARMIYPDIIGGLYTPDELKELREAA